MGDQHSPGSVPGVESEPSEETSRSQGHTSPPAPSDPSSPAPAAHRSGPPTFDEVPPTSIPPRKPREDGRGPGRAIHQTYNIEVLEKAAQRGGCYEAIVNAGLVDALLNQDIKQSDAARQLGYTQPAVSRAVAQLRLDHIRQEAKERFEQYQAEQEEMWGGWPLHIDLKALDDYGLRQLVDYFAKWRARHFTDRRRKAYTTPEHQRRWAFLILRAIRDGRMLMILAPPRHGKSELLIHLDAFLITRVNPNISIVKVCKTEGMAKKALKSVRDHLTRNEGLIRECLPEGEMFQPAYKSGEPWNNEEFTVATRDVVGLKSPTMAAVGSGGTLLSRDMEVLSLDDIEDDKTVRTPEGRAATREWAANDVGSRKEEWTAFVCIGSRQHPDDIYGYWLDNPEWDVLVEQAHDESACTVDSSLWDDPEHYDEHVDCMLWPEERSYRWLMGVKHDPMRVGSYAMTYQNEPQDADTATFTRELFDSCRDNSRVTGQYPGREGTWIEDDEIHRTRLIAGLDPSYVGHQAVFLWAHDPVADRLYAVDFENNKGGGIARARQQIQEWYERYGVAEWVIESNLFHGGIRDDELLRAFCNLHNIVLHDHQTQGNKWDDTLGVTAMAPHMKKGLVSIPWGDTQTQNYWEAYKRQLVNFSRDRIAGSRVKKKGVSDLVMASWFPWETTRRWRREYLTEAAENQARQQGWGSPFVPAADLNSLFPSTFSAFYAGVS